MITQYPHPGQKLLKFCGDVITFTVKLPQEEPGQVRIRTNLGHARTTREEIIARIEHESARLGRDWFDIPMRKVDQGTYQITLPLDEVGHFEAKCLFFRHKDKKVIWPSGDNVVVNVEPAHTCCANTMYNAFVRQFGPNKEGRKTLTDDTVHWVGTLDKDGYAVIPPSGKFRDLKKEIGFIVGTLGCRLIQLLPIHPTPTTYGRMGRFGSPYAALDFTGIDPALAEFDPKATPLEQFVELVDTIHKHNARVIIDIATNHTGWAAELHETHPEWLKRSKDGTIKMPGAWGVTWADLTALNYEYQDLWKYMSEVFLTWCKRGVDGFRCDAGYMIPVEAWQYIVAIVREQYPDTIFFLEGLGGLISVTRDILNKANFNWAYSELFQNYDRGQIEYYLPGALEIAKSEGLMVHFAETHDNLRLAAKSTTYASMRTGLCALTSECGGFAFANGVEWFATEKINVHDAPSLNWGSSVNQVDYIARLNRLLKMHPAFFDQTELSMVQEGPGNCIAMLRKHLPSQKQVIVLVNLDPDHAVTVKWNRNVWPFDRLNLVDLISGQTVTVERSESRFSCHLDAGQVFCLSPDFNDLGRIEQIDPDPFKVPERVLHQRFRKKVIEIYKHVNGYKDVSELDLDSLARQLAHDPVSFCRARDIFHKGLEMTVWQWPIDEKRQVMLPPGHFMMILADHAFRARIVKEDCTLIQEESLHNSSEKHFALICPIDQPEDHVDLTLHLSVHTPQDSSHVKAPLLLLGRSERVSVKQVFDRHDVLNDPLMYLGTNQRGGMQRANADFTQLLSKYDALLSANLNPDYPEDRWIGFTRCRAWVVYQGYSIPLCLDCLEQFSFKYPNQAVWQYRIPTGQGQDIDLTVVLRMQLQQNRICLTIGRHQLHSGPSQLAKDESVQVILRPEIEDRSFHDTTKAYTGPEKQFSQQITCDRKGFVFAPDQKRQLKLTVSQGEFNKEPEWQYMVFHQNEAQRGMDPHSDLFSPGYFAVELKGTDEFSLIAGYEGMTDPQTFDSNIVSEVNLARQNMPAKLDLETAMRAAMDQFLVRRDKLKTVIAGYPWFLDWGRDTLIFARGLIAAGEYQTTKEILTQFAMFENKGTIPNMIRGNDASDRDTSDAPLWLVAVCQELCDAMKNRSLLKTKCGDRSLKQVLISIGEHMVTGTPNQIKVDPESGLLFSPAHFTWMDTNYPAGTPRNGYPIEIQALWFAALDFLEKIDSGNRQFDWQQIKHKVQTSIVKYFWNEQQGYLYDCLRAKPGQPAHQASPDDALRPNQLFAITLKALTDHDIAVCVLDACASLLVPGAIRSLADRPVKLPLEISHHGQTLNDPYNPYHGVYAGDEDTQRKKAYHNGTAWTWVFPSYCEAYLSIYGQTGIDTAKALLSGTTQLINRGCAGHIPEILDGDYPHTQRGCDAQAWSVSELLRVWLKTKP